MLAWLRLIGWIKVVAPIVPCFAVQQALPTPELDRLGFNAQHARHFVPGEEATLAEPLITRHELVRLAHLAYTEAGKGHTATGARVACGKDGANFAFGVLVQ